MGEVKRTWVLAVLVGIAGMFISVSLFGSSTYTLSGLEIESSVSLLDGGMTEIVLPPLGTVRAHTHQTALSFTFELRSVEPDQLRNLMELLQAPNVALEVEERLSHLFRHFLLRLLALGALGGAVLALIVGLRNPSHVALSVLSSIVVLALLVGIALNSYQIQAFEEPEFTGAIAAAPWMVGLAEQSVSKVVEFSDKLQLLTSNLYRFFQSVEQLEALGEVDRDRTILLVSDFHNNPAAVSMVARVVETFAPDFIIDAGDITDYGTEFEFEGLKRLGNLEIPYLLVPGNHESPAVLAQLANLPNVSVIADRSTVVRGIRIYGVQDPSAHKASPEGGSQAEISGKIAAAEHELQEGAAPFILVAHNPDIAAPFFNGSSARIPVVVSGHTHRLSLTQDAGRVWLNPGTTGAAGIRGLMSPQEVPYSLVLLYVRSRPESRFLGDNSISWEPVAVDTLTISNLEGSFTIERILLNENPR